MRKWNRCLVISTVVYSPTSSSADSSEIEEILARQAHCADLHGLGIGCKYFVLDLMSRPLTNDARTLNSPVPKY